LTRCGHEHVELAVGAERDPEVLVMKRQVETRGAVVLEEVAAPDLHHPVAREAA
jgi:hypothetical protein